MPVSLDETSRKVVLTGACVVEEAETLNEILQTHAEWPIDAGECEYLHTAVLQVLMSQQPKWLSLPKPPHLRRVMEQIFSAQNKDGCLSRGEQI